MLKSIVKNLEDSINDVKSNRAKLVTKTKKQTEEEICSLQNALNIFLAYAVPDNEGNPIIDEHTKEKLREQYSQIKNIQEEAQDALQKVLLDYSKALVQAQELLAPFVENPQIEAFEHFVLEGTLPKSDRIDENMGCLASEKFDLSEEDKPNNEEEFM